MSVWGKGKKGCVSTTIYKVCPGSQHLFNILSVHLKNLIMRIECLLVGYLQPGVPPCPPHLSAAQLGPSPVLVPTLSVPHTPLLGVPWDPSCCVPCAGTLGAAAKAPSACEAQW